MENSFNNGLTPILNDLIPKSIPKEENFNKINALPLVSFIKHEEIENCSILEPIVIVDVKEEHSDEATPVKNVISTSTVKIEPEWDHFDIQHLSVDNLTCRRVKAEPIFIVQTGEKVTEKNKYILDSLHQFSGTTLDGSKDFSSTQLKKSVKPENSETKIKMEKCLKLFYADQKIRLEDVDLKEEKCLGNKIRSKNLSSTQLEEPLKTEKSEIKVEIEKCPEVFYMDQKIKPEEVDIKEKALLKIEISDSSRDCSERKYKDYKKYKCHLCDYETKRKSDFRIHFLRHQKPEEVDLFKCNECEFQSRYKRSVKNHLLKHKKLEEITLFRCDQCEYQTRYKNTLKTHLMRHKKIEEITLFTCDQCEYQTRYKSSLKSHLLGHKKLEEVTLYRCDKCDYHARVKGNLKIHLLKHENVQEVNLFKCDKCEFQTRYRTVLKNHILRHKNPEDMDLLSCGECTYQTYIKSNLRSHLSRHRNSKQCDKCEFQTSHQAAFRMHTLQH